jgi:hypothetical protein
MNPSLLLPLPPPATSNSGQTHFPKWLVLAFILLVPRALFSADTGETTSLGFELSYLRVHSLAEAMPTINSAFSASRALVLDLRYATVSDESAGTLKTLLAERAPDSELFILVSPATPSSMADALTSAAGNWVTLGVKESQPTPKIIVKTTAEIDRRAYDAAAAGTPVEKLISGKIEKDRFDEATLVQEFKNGNPDGEPPTSRPPGGPAKADPAKVQPGAENTPAPLVDRVLQRAFQIHRALQALHR